jgi:hypothetical protein
MAQHCLSPLVQVMQQPSDVYSHLQWQLANEHLQHSRPLHVQLQLHKPSHSILQRFCNVADDISSSHLQCILKPPVHFSNSILQRGTTHQLPAAGAAAGNPGDCHVGIAGAEAAEKRSIITALDMENSFRKARHKLIAAKSPRKYPKSEI